MSEKANITAQEAMLVKNRLFYKKLLQDFGKDK